MTAQILLGNGVFFLGAVILVLLGLIKTKRNILIAQILQEAFMGAGMLILGGIAGFIVDVISIFRNLVCIKWNYTLKWKLIFIAAQAGLYAVFGTEGLCGWLPVVAMCLFTWFLDSENVILLKVLIAVMQLMWLVYDISIVNYVGMVVDVVSAVTNVVGIFLVKKKD
ncbi:MAG: YgjV family protein [Spirochaetia bacterium]|nr:YgjV family protein [Spirochaetia bacterium]